jgi:Acetyltransferase (GNAT) domain
MDNKDLYRELCLEEPSIPLFLQAWWLDATCGVAAWDVVIALRGGKIHAGMPYVATKRRGFRFISGPELTQFLGPWIRDTGAKLANEYGRQKELMQELTVALPPYDHFQQNWSPTVTNWLPFYLKGFKQTTRYTYRLTGLDDFHRIYAGFSDSVRNDIRRAKGRMRLEVCVDQSIDCFLLLNRLTFARQGMNARVSEFYIRTVDAACVERQCRLILVARDADGRAHAGVYIVWGAGVAYYLLGGSDPKLRNSGASTLCLATAIEMTAGKAQCFDFEGSMIESVERFFRAFGAEQTPYFQVSRTPSRLIRSYLFLKDIVSRK